MPVALPAQTSTVHQPSLTLNPVTFGVPAKGVMLHQAVPSTSSAEIEPMAPRGGSQDQLKLLKRKSVEFSGAVQLGSSPQQVVYCLHFSVRYNQFNRYFTVFISLLGGE